MKILGIDNEKCIVCGECVLDCPPELFTMNMTDKGNEAVTYDDPFARCISCGHCIAVCPRDAVLFSSDEKPLRFDSIEDPAGIVPYETFRQFALARRSIRRFSARAVDTDTIRQVLEAMRYAPSASNKQEWEFVVVTNPEMRNLVTRTVLGLMKMVKLLTRVSWIAMPFLKKGDRNVIGSKGTRPAIERVLSEFEKGRDHVLFNAPCVIILHSPGYGHLADNDAGISLTIGMLAAQSLGLGTCWIGFAQETFALSGKLRKRFEIPKGHRVRGVLALGYPDVRYNSVPVRKPLRVRWM
jgi:nitroreductase/NAD-dependent dihydropyrimidine dehydrogenase PreA subunit